VIGELALSDLPPTTPLRELLLGLCPEDEATLRDLERSLHATRTAMEGVRDDENIDRIRIMTMHSAKGLTAEAVIVAACDDQLIPGVPADQRELDDLRRLLYVSLDAQGPRASGHSRIYRAFNRHPGARGGGRQARRPPCPTAAAIPRLGRKREGPH
jgi:hypothetical protein